MDRNNRLRYLNGTGPRRPLRMNACVILPLSIHHLQLLVVVVVLLPEILVPSQPYISVQRKTLCIQETWLSEAHCTSNTGSTPTKLRAGSDTVAKPPTDPVIYFYPIQYTGNT